MWPCRRWPRCTHICLTPIVQGCGVFVQSSESVLSTSGLESPAAVASACVATAKPTAMRCTSAQASAVPGLLARLERFTVNVRYVPDINPKHMPERMQIGQLEGMPILSYRENPTLGLGGITKRTIDIAGALVGLTLLSPLLFAIAVAIRFTSPGRVLFKQSRVSIGSDEFKIYKFRTILKA